MSLRLRLTLLYSNFMGGILLIFGAAVFILVNIILLNQVDTMLAGVVRDITQVTRVNSVGELNVINLPPLDMTANAYVQVWGRDGNLASTSPSTGTLREPLDPASYDAVVFNLILSVIPEGRLCLQENLRALKPGGRAVVFDKFVPDGSQVSLGRRVLNFFSTLLGTETTRRFGDFASGLPCRVIANEPSLMRGRYRIILLAKTG